MHGTTDRSLMSVGLRCRCPRCGEGALFRGFLTLKPCCDACGLDDAFADPADGPAFFIMMTMAFPVTAFGIWLELAYDPPLWLHAVLTLPVLLLACVPIIRPLKGVFIASQYINRAEEGRFAVPGASGPGAGKGPDRGARQVQKYPIRRKVQLI